jgi:hypothetical protein
MHKHKTTLHGHFLCACASTPDLLLEVLAVNFKFKYLHLHLKNGKSQQQMNKTHTVIFLDAKFDISGKTN